MPSGKYKRSLEMYKNRRKDDFHVACGTILQQYKNNAKSRGIEFSLTRNDIKKIVSKDCFYCGSSPTNMVNTFNGRTKHEHSPVFYNGIDRIDNTKGYILDNIVPCCHRCNWAKKDLSLEQFYSWIDKVYKNLSKNTVETTPNSIDVATKGMGILVDDLCTTSQKLWHLQEIYMDSNSTDKDIADAFRKIQTLNVRRNALINAIDKMVNPNIATTTEKTYK